MANDRCKKHLRRDCSTCETGTYARRVTPASSSPDQLADPISPVHQAVYGGAYYGSVDTTPSPSSCDSGSSSSSSSDSSSSSSYDSGSSSSSYDSGSSSSYDSGC